MTAVRGAHRRLAFALLLGAAMLFGGTWTASEAYAVYAPSSFVDTLYADTVIVPDGGYDAGDTIWVGIGVDNDTAAVAGVSALIRLRDTTKIRVASVPDSGTSPVTYYAVARRTSRASASGFDAATVIFSMRLESQTKQDLISALMVDLAISPPVAALPIGDGVVFEIAFIAKAGIAKGDFAAIEMWEGVNAIGSPFDHYPELAYSSGLETIYPVLRDGIVLFGSSTPPVDTTNSAPVIAFDPTPVVYNISQGETVSFTVTATDLDTTSDQVTLSATIPAGASFSPSNPVTGPVTTSGTFEWTPNFSQDGAFTATFSASDDKGASVSRSVSINVEKQQVDIIFTASTFDGVPRGGIPGKPVITLPIDVLATRVIYGLQFDLVLDGSAFRVDSIIPTSKLAGFTLWDNLGVNPDTIRVITFSVAGDSIPLGGISTIMDFAISVDSNATPGVYPVTFANAWESITPDPTVSSIQMTSKDGVLFVDRLGDINLDTLVNVADMVGLTSHILGSYTLSPRGFDAADVNVDTAANVIDLVAIINAVLGFAPLTAAPRFDGGQAELNLVYSGMEGDQAVFYLEGTMPTDVAGMELTLKWDPDQVVPTEGLGAASGAQNLTMKTDYSVVRRTDRMKVVGYYDAKAEHAIQPGHGRYLKVPVVLRQPWTDLENPPIAIESVVLSDLSAARVGVQGFDDEDPGILPTDFALEQNYPNPFNPRTTIGFTINGGSGERVSLKVYNVLGRHVVSLVDEPMTAGRHEVVWDGRNAQGGRVASGLYLYRLVVGGRSETRKMVLLK